MALLEAIYSRTVGAERWPQVGNIRVGPDRAMRLRVRCGSIIVGSAKVVVTRESGKNGKLMKALGERGIHCLELPLIEHRPGPDLHKLSDAIRDIEFEWIVVTSPEAATVFIKGWRDAGYPKVRVAVVGVGTGQEFDKVNVAMEALQLGFSPSKATAKVLAEELPTTLNGSRRVLYPSSAKAGSELETGLLRRGFEESVKVLDQEKVAAAMVAPVATFGSPTAVKAWVEHLPEWNGAAACIGFTSAQAARKAGLNNVFYPESPGIEGWVESVMDALGSQVHDTSVV